MIDTPMTENLNSDQKLYAFKTVFKESPTTEELAKYILLSESFISGSSILFGGIKR